MLGEPARAQTQYRDPQPAMTAAFRTALLSLTTLLMSLQLDSALSLLWVAPLAGVELYVRGRRLSDAQLERLGYLWVTLSAAGVIFTGGSRSDLLPLILGGAYLAGLGAGTLGVLTQSGLGSAVLLAVWVSAHSQLTDSAVTYLVSCTEWVFLGIGISVAGRWIGLREVQLQAGGADGHAEARALLRQLKDVTTHLPGSLDLATTCEMLLDSCAAAFGATTGVVFLHVGDGQLVPMAMRGTRRVPWRGPSAGHGPLQVAWETGQHVLDVRTADPTDRPRVHSRRGSVLLVVPILSPDGVLAMVALQRPPHEGDGKEQIAEVQEIADRYAVPLETAQLFETVRAATTVEERNRLAHDMHDGVAQDLAYIGFELDMLRSRVATDPELSDAVSELRRETTRIIGDIRTSITDLRSSRSVERGLGAMVASLLRNAGTTADVSIHLSLTETAFRLPAEVEIELLRTVKEFTAIAVRRANAANLWVTLLVDPPVAALRLEHDGCTGPYKTTGLTASKQRIEELGGTFTCRATETGMTAEASFEGKDQ
jgi:signal transduction histidine kinase